MSRFPYRPDVVLAPAWVAERPETIDRLNELLADAGFGRPLSPPAAPAPPDVALIEVPVQGDPVAVARASRWLSGRAEGVPECLPDYECTAATVEDGARREANLYPNYRAGGRKSGHGTVAWLPAPDHVMPPKPRRRPDRDFPAGRPVVALLDTGVREHDWLVEADGEPCWEEAEGWTPPRAIPEIAGQDGRGDESDEVDFGSHWGHGTFLTGLMRLEAPDAKILSVRVMSDAGRVSDLNAAHALNWLADRAGDGRRLDVVLTAFGRPGSDGDEELRPVRKALERLADLGVQVVASAGNGGADDPVYPAAFAADPTLTVISVGARSSPTVRAPYSNHGVWVSRWHEGTHAVSTMPLATTPAATGGAYAYWSGTSFAAARCAGRLAHRLAPASAPVRLPE
ncbi:S8/S53 family peptidase [Micromonospora sp. WMMD1128]|uniref:S8 family peptidase n=1 Tax=unclassified Micromonospora TaxID=2617518 RepID=UPI00248B2FB3|nr:MULTISPECIES: S8/S53 family peptidase [unclassified Micromonospora]WBB75902.1 S8/S53 family peptidase [Micromonospora sp. WMMD1128]WFE36312.1 S8/S53 family peptidase [Micromonospora sp. WMMD975]